MAKIATTQVVGKHNNISTCASSIQCKFVHFCEFKHFLMLKLFEILSILVGYFRFYKWHLMHHTQTQANQ